MTESNGMLAVIERFASSPDVDVLKLEKMLEMQERIMAKQAEIDFNTDMAKLRAELPEVLKNKYNNQTKSNYADLFVIKTVIDPILSKHGFYDRYEDDFPSDGVVGTTCEIVHRNGFSRKNRVQFVLDDRGIQGSVNKTKVHAVASSMTYGQRIALCRALGIRIAEDDDGNKAVTPKTADITTEQVAELTALITKKGTDLAIVLSAYKVAALEHMNADQYAHCKKRLLSTKEKANV